MIIVKIAYDPYHMKTSLNINGQNVKRTARGYERISKFIKEDIPLQSWIDPIPYQNWKGLLWEIIGDSLETEVEFQFRGRKIDFLDLEEAMTAQSTAGNYEVTIHFPMDKQKLCYNDQDILERAKKAYTLIQSDGFKQILDDKLFEIGKDSALYTAYQNLGQKYDEAMNGEFRIVFSGMYTCGKSTIINAILGKEILPTRDGTCTSKVFKIYHDPEEAFARMSCVDKDGQTVVEEQAYTEESLKEKFSELFPRKGEKLLPSNPPTIDTVIIHTSIASLYPENASYQQGDVKIVIVDTPGANSGTGNEIEGETNHFEIAKRVIESGKKEMVIFAVNATEDQNESIVKFLKMVDATDPHKAYDQRYLFVLNKADGCTLKEDESWSGKLKGTENYYSNDGKRAIRNPRFFPTSALAAFSIRSGRSDGYEKVKPCYYHYDEEAEEMIPTQGRQNYYFDEFCSTSQAIKDDIHKQIQDINNDSKLKIADKRKQEILLHSGIVSLEMAIQDYIEKYAFPLKIQDLLQSYEIIFKETDQLVGIASSNFDKAVKALESTDAQKSAEEAERVRTKQIHESLKKVKEKIAYKKSELNGIAGSFRKDVRIQSDDIKAKMWDVIQEALKMAKKNAKRDNIRVEIKGYVDQAIVDCHSEISNHFSRSREKAKELETEIVGLFQEIQTIIDFGDNFSITNTTAFHDISTDSIAEIENEIRTIRNPELDEGFFLFRPIKNLFVFDKTVPVNAGINLKKLESELANIKCQFDLDIDKTLDKSASNLEEASIQLQRNLDRLESRIEEYADQMKKMNANIEKMALDVTEKAKFEKKLQKFRELLLSVQQYTYFDELREE